MRKLKILFISIIVFSSFAFCQENLNWVGYGDTARVKGFRADSLKFTKWFSLSKWQNLLTDCMINDTSVIGFASDSIKVVWGYQTGHKVRSADTLDTLHYTMRAPVPVDTIDIVGKRGMYDGNSLNRLDYIVDTVSGVSYQKPLSVDTGDVGKSKTTQYAVQSRNISPQWDVMIRYWIKGLTGNKVGSYNDVKFQHNRRQYDNTRGSN